MVLDLTPPELYEQHRLQAIQRRKRRIDDSELFKFVTQDDIDRKILKVMTPVIVIRRVGERAGKAKQFEWNALMNSSNYYIINYSNLDDLTFIQLINNCQFPGVIEGEVSNSLSKRTFIDSITREYHELRL